MLSRSKEKTESLNKKQMKISVVRKYRKETYTIGNLFVNGVWECNTLEDRDRGLTQADSMVVIKSKKVAGETAIPIGNYNVRMDVVSPKYSSSSYYKSLCGGRVPRLEKVPGFDGILVHTGSSALDTAGCLLVGRNTVKGKLTSSRDTFTKLYKKMNAAYKRGEKITIEISW